MKNKIKLSWLLLSVLMISMLFADIPAGYYDAASGLTGNDLKEALHNIIDDHTAKTYDYVWEAFKTTDVRTIGGSEFIWCMYTHINFIPGTDQQGANPVMTAVYNREHSWPKSWTNESHPHYTDLYHLYPVQGTANSTRSNNAYGEVAEAQHTYFSDNGTKSGPARAGLAYTGTVFEPIDEYKGDLARTYFYISTRYYTEDSDWGDGDWPMTIRSELKDWAVDMLLNWHENDPVSQKELDRVEAVYSIQGNRNPFIDHPEYVQAIWDQPMEGFVAPRAKTASSVLENSFTANWTKVSEATGYNLYVSTSSDFSNCISGYDPCDVGDVQARIVTGLSPSTLYYYRVTAYREAEETGNSNIITVETAPPTATVDSTKIFFSEYIEGSSNNKALEIYNATGEDIDLSMISIKTYFNGNTSASGNLSLSGALLNNDVYVIVNNLASSTMTASADLITNSQAMIYNGNDAIELYYNGALIDIIGKVGESAIFAEDVTMLRKPEILNGNTTYTPSEWDRYSKDTFSYLGSHTVNDFPLSINLASFTAEVKQAAVELKWTTASETANSHFLLYRNDEVLVKIDGAGTTSVSTDYLYIDNTAIPGIEYTYVLADVNYSSIETRHEDRAVTIEIRTHISDIDFVVSAAYPNPFNPILTLSLQYAEASNTQLSIYNTQGILVEELINGYMNAGHHKIIWDALDMPSGIYIIKAMAGNTVQSQKVALIK